MNTLPSLSDGLKIFMLSTLDTAKPTQVRTGIMSEPRMPVKPASASKTG